MPPRCPVCTSGDVVPILYGLPDEELQRRVTLGLAVMGGCMVGGDQPQWHCRKCGYEFGGAAYA